ncbi:MAG: hypothetical protein Fur0041_14450 [Bacteroidia bacterium]
MLFLYINLFHVKSILFCFITLFSLSVSSLKAFDNPPVGARAQGMAGCGTAVNSDVWGLQNNQAAIAGIKSFQAAMFYESRFLVNGLGMKAFASALPIKQGVFGLSVTSFGYNLYSENKAGIAYARTFGPKISAGVQINYQNTRIAENYGSASSATAELGILAEPVKNLKIGFHLFNPTRSKLSGNLSERIPTVMRLGALYSFSEKVFLTAEAEKDIDYKANFRGGIEYRPVPNFYLRAGAGSNPGLAAFGFGVVMKKLRLDVASSFHSVLGFSPAVSLQYGLE